MSTIDEFTKAIIAFRDERDWKQFHTPKDMVLSLMMEVAELAEHVQWKNGIEIAQRLQERRDEVGQELADVLYWTLLIAHDFGVDLSHAFAQKMRVNEEKYPIEKARGRHTKYSELS